MMLRIGRKTQKNISYKNRVFRKYMSSISICEQIFILKYIHSRTSFSGQDIILWTAISGGWNALPLLHKVTLYHLKGGKNQAILHFSLFLLVLKTLIKMAPGATLLPKTSNSTVFIYVGEFLMKTVMKTSFFVSAQPIL